MRIEERSYEVYEYVELNDDAKQKAFEKVSEMIIDDRFEWLKADLEDELNYKWKIDDAEVFYSLSYSQGDGLHFITSDLLTTPVVEEVKKHLTEADASLFDMLLPDASCYTKHDNNFYEYASKYDVRCEWCDEDEYDADAISRIEKAIESVYLSICNRLEKIGYDCYDVNDEDVIDYCLVCEIEFFKSGLIFNL